MVARLLTFCDGSKDCYAGFPIWLLLNHISIMFALDKEKGIPESPDYISKAFSFRVERDRLDSL